MRPIPVIRHLRVRHGLVHLAVGAAAALLAGCASAPVPPDWQTNSHGALKDFTRAYLAGNSRVAAQEFARLQTEIAATGRTDLAARAIAVRCAVRVASLEFDNCAGFEPLAVDAGTPERSYVAYLTGRWPGMDLATLPQQHRGVVTATDPNARQVALAGMQDPLSRLIAAGALLQIGQLSPAGVALAVQSASAEGWRRPLLAWLGVQLKLADSAGDVAAKAVIQRRIDLATGDAAPGLPAAKP